MPGSIVIPAGSTSGTFEVTAGSVGAPVQVTLTASYLGANEGFGVTIDPPPATLSGVSVNPASILAGQSAAGTVTLTAPAGAGGVNVSLSSSNPSVAAVPLSVIVPQGSLSATFPVTTGIVQAATPVVVTASYAGVNAQVTVIVDIINSRPALLWQNQPDGPVTVNYYGGTGGNNYSGWAWLNGSGIPGWHVAAAADFDRNGVPDLVWQNDSTGQATIHYYGGPDGTTDIGWAWLCANQNPGWHIVAAADFDQNGVPDLVWQNDATRQVTVMYYGGANGATYLGWAWLNETGNPGWHVVGAADFDRNGVPDLIWQNDSTRQVTVNYYGGPGGATYIGWAFLNAGGVPGWTAKGAIDLDQNGVPDLIWEDDSTGMVTVNYYGGPGGAQYLGWAWMNSGGNPGWNVIVP